VHRRECGWRPQLCPRQHARQLQPVPQASRGGVEGDHPAATITPPKQSDAPFQENLREGSDILRAGAQGEHGQDSIMADKHPDADRRATIGKLIRALSIIDENDEGLLSLQQLLQVTNCDTTSSATLLCMQPPYAAR
jgi:hypothetical protein